MGSRNTVATMNKLTSCVVAAVVALPVVTLAGGPALATVPQREARLTGAAEVPGPGDADGRGQFTWSLDGTRLCYLLSVKRIETAGRTWL